MGDWCSAYGDDQSAINDGGLTREEAEDAIAQRLLPKEELWMAPSPAEPAPMD